MNLRGLGLALFCGVVVAGQVTAYQEQQELGGAGDLTYPEFASPKEIPPRDFAKDPGITSASLSPNGKHYLTVSPHLEKLQIRVYGVEAEDKETHFVGSIEREKFAGVYWASDERLLIELEEWNLDKRWRWFRKNSLIAVDINGDNMEHLLSRRMTDSLAAVDELIVDLLPNDKDHVLIMTEGKDDDDPALSKLEIYTGETEQVMAGRKGVIAWRTDHEGVARLGIGYDDDRMKLIARPSSKGTWIDLHDNEVFEDGRFFPLRFDFDGDTMFVKSAVANGRFAIYRFDLTTGKLAEKLFEHSDVDVRNIEYSLKHKTLQAVTYIEDKLERRFFDERHEKLMGSIDRVLPGRSNYILDRSNDDRFYLIYSVSDRYPGALYRLDTLSGKMRMEVLEEMNKQINPKLMSPTQRIDYFARDGLEIPAYMTVPRGVEAKNLPAVVLPHGGPQARSEIEYDRMVQFLASRGYLVLQPNYRGSTGYSYEYQSLGYGEWGGAMQTDLEDGVDYLVDEGIIDPDRVCIMGQSGYGSYTALLGVMKSPDRFRCAVAIAPITDLKTRIKDVKKGSGKNAAKRISGDRSGKEIKAVSPIQLIKQLDRPLLMFHGGKDRYVPREEFEKFEKKLAKAGKDFETVKSKDEAHGLNKPKSRTKFLRKLEEFLVEHIGEGTVMVETTTAEQDAAVVGGQ